MKQFALFFSLILFISSCGSSKNSGDAKEKSATTNNSTETDQDSKFNLCNDNPIVINDSPSLNPAIIDNKKILFITPAGCGKHDGSSWQNAISFKVLYQLKNYSPVELDKIYLSQGNYLARAGQSIEIPATFTNNLRFEIIGSFRGDSSDEIKSDLNKYSTIFCGSVLTDNDCSSNRSYYNNLFNFISAVTIKNIKIMRANIAIKSSAVLTLDGVEIAYNGANDQAILLNSSNAEIYNSKLYNNYSNYGAAISAANSDITINNSSIYSNSSKSYGSTFESNNLNSKNNVFFSNQATAVKAKIAFVSGSYFANNYEKSSCGGAIFTTNQLLVINSIFNGNSSITPGSAICSEKTMAVNSVFYNHAANKATISTISTSNLAKILIINSIIYDLGQIIGTNQMIYNSIVNGGGTNGINIISPASLTLDLSSDLQANSRYIANNQQVKDLGAKVWLDASFNNLYFLQAGAGDLNKDKYPAGSANFRKLTYNKSWIMSLDSLDTTLDATNAVNYIDMFGKTRTNIPDIGPVEF